MTTKPTLLTLLFFFLSTIASAQHYPGGVKGAEVWYKAEFLDLATGNFQDFSSSPVTIENCEGHDYDARLFNFNPSIHSDNLCLSYKAPLEQSTNKSIFIVTDPHDNQDPYPHVGTLFNDFVQPPYLDSISRNTFVIETKQGVASRMASTFSQHQNAHVHFYSWDNYDIDKKFKSYGLVGETNFFIGAKLQNDDLDNGPGFSGLFPEYVTFDRKLTKNERNRVESYLALKYGITKWHTEDYQNSKNKVFWNKDNNHLFGNNIFGIGRDDISGLNQLQCESAHARDFLVAATYEIMVTNEEVQDIYMIENDNFLVFGDTAEGGVNEEPDDKNLHRMRRVWLAQAVGDKIRDVPIRFRLNLTEAFANLPYLVDEVVNEQQVVWMLHDPSVSYDFVSDFDNGNVDYYMPFDIEVATNGDVYANFGHNIEEIFFDKDNGYFDQFTFAIGPECLVQFRPRYNCEEIAEGSINCYELDIIIEGDCREQPEFVDGDSKPIEVWFNEEQTELNGQTTFTAGICAPGTYTAFLNTAQGTFGFEYEAEVIEQFIVDLGPGVQYLSGQQPEVLLNAGQYINDPQASYQWFENGVQIPYVDSSLMVGQPGYYCVIVTTSDQVCQIERCVDVRTKLEAEVICQSGYCDLSANEVHITILDGASPYTTVVTDNTGQIVQQEVHGGNTVINNIPEGYFTITITDSLGAEYQTSCGFEQGFQMTEYFNVVNPVLSIGNPQIVLDASSFWGGTSNFVYGWKKDGAILSQETPQLQVLTPGEYQVTVYFPDFDCNGKATQIITSVLEGTIHQDGDCEEFTNTVVIGITYGFGDYTTVIEGVEHPSGDPYYYEVQHDGGIPISGIPYGSYTVTVTDQYQNTIQQPVEFVGLHLNIEDQMINFCNQCGSCFIQENWCGTDYTIIGPNEVCSGGMFSLDASLLVNSSQDVIYQWELNGVNLNHSDPILIFNAPSDCSGFWNDHTFMCDSMYLTVTIFEKATSCSSSETILIPLNWCPVLEPPYTPLQASYNTTIYPNPSGSDATFYYKISTTSPDSFSGQVEVFSMLGQLIFSNHIQGQTEYTLPYRLIASGAYIIRTTTDDGTVTVDRVIIK